ncbi:VOC family protein [Terricaulis sp.]|uniref:bleomycin resistance protein n=1 Tax=Terricaulis sp. TaxID=2768686 RepID=UPI002AC51E7E|nr:VOC family protein [Terricaulis sp.]MDZ4692697.1 VOC family protein [Terricaulis sp.]
MEKGKFIRITPFIHVPDINAAVKFFEDLGFVTYFRMGDYAYVQRETAGVRLMQNHGDDGAPAGNRRFSYYIDVEDIEALYRELKPVLDAMPAGDVHGPADKPYGQREVCVLAPDGNLLVFGQSIGG